MIEKDAQSIDTMTADIVSAYVTNNSISVKDLPELIRTVQKALMDVATGINPPASGDGPIPAVHPSQSVHDQYLVCLEDGLKFTSLKRHLMAHHGMTPDEYRLKWNLPSSYPMITQSYANRRSAIAITLGLGRKAK